jgi:hypothetical protein
MHVDILFVQLLPLFRREPRAFDLPAEHDGAR